MHPCPILFDFFLIIFGVVILSSLLFCVFAFDLFLFIFWLFPWVCGNALFDGLSLDLFFWVLFIFHYPCSVWELFLLTQDLGKINASLYHRHDWMTRIRQSCRSVLCFFKRFDWCKICLTWTNPPPPDKKSNQCSWMDALTKGAVFKCQINFLKKFRP